MSSLTRSQSVLQREDTSRSGDVVFFSQSFEEPYDDWRRLRYEMGIRLWQELGEPDEITITVEPGDTLNMPDPGEIGVENG